MKAYNHSQEQKFRGYFFSLLLLMSCKIKGASKIKKHLCGYFGGVCLFKEEHTTQYYYDPNLILIWNQLEYWTHRLRHSGHFQPGFIPAQLIGAVTWSFAGTTTPTSLSQNWVLRPGAPVFLPGFASFKHQTHWRLTKSFILVSTLAFWVLWWWCSVFVN